MPETEAAQPTGDPDRSPSKPAAEPGLARTVKELPDGRYLLLYDHGAEPLENP